MADVTVESLAAIDSPRKNNDGQWVVWINTTTGYVFLVDTGDDFNCLQSTDSGATWTGFNGGFSTIKTGVVEAFAVWYDKWTPGNTGALIHLAYIDNTPDDVFYNNIDTADDSTNGEVTIKALTSVSPAGGPRISITRARGGNLYCAGTIDGGTEVFFARSTDVGATWADRTACFEAAADQIRLFPANTSDSQDIGAIYWDISAGEATIKMIDDSANTTTEFATPIATGLTDLALLTGNPQYALSVRHSDSHILLALWNAPDNAASDLLFLDITAESITTPVVTAKTNLVTNTANCSLVAVFINQNTDDIYVTVVGKPDGTETLPSGTANLWYFISTDGGTTWTAVASAVQYSATGRDHRAIASGLGGTTTRFEPAFYDDDLDDIFVNVDNSIAISPPETVTLDKWFVPVNQPVLVGAKAVAY